jgi:hypothetical protein
LPEGSEAVGNDNQAAGALVLEGPDAPLDHCQASVLANRTESMSDPVAPTPALETLRGELSALV